MANRKSYLLFSAHTVCFEERENNVGSLTSSHPTHSGDTGLQVVLVKAQSTLYCWSLHYIRRNTIKWKYACFIGATHRLSLAVLVNQNLTVLTYNDIYPYKGWSTCNNLIIMWLSLTALLNNRMRTVNIFPKILQYFSNFFLTDIFQLGVLFLLKYYTLSFRIYTELFYLFSSKCFGGQERRPANQNTFINSLLFRCICMNL